MIVALRIENAKHSLLGFGQHLAGVDRRVARLLNDVGAGVDQRAKHRLVANDAGVVLGVGRGGHFLAHLEQIGGAADDFVFAGILELLQQKLQLDRPAAVVHREDVVKIRAWAWS